MTHNQEIPKKPEEVRHPPINPMWILKPQYHYIYFRDGFWAKKDIFVPVNNANGMKFLDYILNNSPIDLSKHNVLKELNLDEKCEDQIELPKKYTNLLYLTYNNGKIYQDAHIKPGLLGYTTTKFRPSRVLGISSFRLFVFTAACKVTAFLYFAKMLEESIQIRKREL